MHYYELIKEEINKIPNNKIFSSNNLFNKIRLIYQDLSEMEFNSCLDRLVNSSYIVMLSNGVFVRTTNSIFGIVIPNIEDLIFNFIEKEKGMLIGYHLYNKLNLSTQISKSFSILTSNNHNKTKIDNIFLKQCDIVYSSKIKKIIEMLEVLSNIEKIQDLNENNFINYCVEFSNNIYEDNKLDYILTKINYDKNVLYFLKLILDYYKTPNQINKYLSKNSNYYIPEVKYYESA